MAYVIRDKAAVPPEADDPAANYDTPENEMISRMPHQDGAGADLPTCIQDRSKVWQTMAEICRDNRQYISTVKVLRDQASQFDIHNSQCSTVLRDINPNLQDDYLINSFERNVKVSSTGTGKRKGNLTVK